MENKRPVVYIFCRQTDQFEQIIHSKRADIDLKCVTFQLTGNL